MKDVTHITAYFKEEEIKTKDKLLETFLKEAEERALLPFLFEWEMLIRATQLFPVTNFHLLSEDIKNSIIRKNFNPELSSLEDLINRLAVISIRLENRNSEFYTEFEDFIEEYFMRKYGIMTLELKKKKREDYWTMMSYATELFLDWRNVLSHLKEKSPIQYQVFFSATRRIVREVKRIPLLENFLLKRFKRPMDRISVKEITDLIASIGEKNERRRVALVFLLVSKLIKYLDHLESLVRTDPFPMRYYPILILIKYEMSLLLKVIDTNRKTIPKLKDLMGKLLVSMTEEYKKVFFGELLNISLITVPSHIREKVGKSVFLLKGILQDTVYEIIRFYNKEVRKEALFPSHIGRKEQAEQALKNIDAVISKIDMHLSSGSVERYEAEEIISYMEKNVMHLLLYKDWETLERLFSDIRKASTKREIFTRIANLKNLLLYLMEEIKKRRVFNIKLEEEKVPEAGR